MTTDFRVAAHTSDVVGEGPIWVAREQALYWVDLLGQKLRRLDGQTGEVTEWTMPDTIGWIVEGAALGAFIVGIGNSIYSLRLDPFELVLLFTPEPGIADGRLNDAKVAPDGRLWFGTMQLQGTTDQGCLYVVDGPSSVRRMGQGYRVPNGPAFDRAGSTLYHADSVLGIVYRIEVRSGLVRDKTEFVRFDPSDGLPDGMTVDAEDCLWVAHWDGGCVTRFTPEGAVDRRVRLPASRITSCTFGGAELDRLFVTSARLDREDEPLAGAVFELNPGVAGVRSPALNLR